MCKMMIKTADIGESKGSECDLLGWHADVVGRVTNLHVPVRS